MKWIESLTFPGWGHLEPFYDAESPLIPSRVGEAVERRIKELEQQNADLKLIESEALDTYDVVSELHEQNAELVNIIKRYVQARREQDIQSGSITGDAVELLARIESKEVKS